MCLVFIYFLPNLFHHRINAFLQLSNCAIRLFNPFLELLFACLVLGFYRSYVSRVVSSGGMCLRRRRSSTLDWCRLKIVEDFIDLFLHLGLIG